MIMKTTILISFFLLIGIPRLVEGMSKNWIPIPQHGICSKNCCVIWKANDSQEQIIIRYCPTTGIYSGKRIRHNNPVVEMPLPKTEVEKYLIELRELGQKA
jgi:hypothetical protein